MPVDDVDDEDASSRAVLWSFDGENRLDPCILANPSGVAAMFSALWPTHTLTIE